MLSFFALLIIAILLPFILIIGGLYWLEKTND